MLVRQNNVAKHAAVLQCIAHDFRELSEHHPDQSEALSDFASLLDHMVASLITGPLAKAPPPTPRLPAKPAHDGVNGHHVV
jgi:uncharacterized membrane-anchored protein YhcB (DUF1043 family)